ncbi:MAG: DUF599 domain-containing protein [Paracoccaceae bacterium]
MELLAHLHLFTVLDAVAVAFAVLGAISIGWLIDHSNTRWPSVSMLMMTYRREWMHEFIKRDPRIYDATVLDGLRSGITFYASGCMIAIGGGLALVGNTEPLQGLANELTLEAASAVKLKVKILFVLGFAINAFLKFVWSHRLFGYCSIMMAAVPNDPAHPECEPRAQQAAEINITAARNYNRGLRSVYFALGALGWLLGAVPLIFTTAVTVALLLRREFASQSRAVMLKRGL